MWMIERKRCERAVSRSVGLGALVLAWLALSGFKAFTEVPSVCPSCPALADLVELSGGGVVDAQLVAHTTHFLVLERFGEYRGLARNEVASIRWYGGHERELEQRDQIVLRSGLVLHGDLVEEQPSAYLVIKVNGRQHVAWFSQIAAVFRSGELVWPASKPQAP